MQPMPADPAEAVAAAAVIAGFADEVVTPDTSLVGPYDAVTNGLCSDGHPLNGFGRCEPLNLAEDTPP